MSTEYIILSRRTAAADELWSPLGTVTARSGRAAIRERLDGAAQSSDYHGDGEYVAIPLRSWQPVTVKTETKTALKFS